MRKTSALLTLLTLAAVGRTAAAAPPPPRAQAFPLRDVRLLDGPFREAQQRGLAYLLKIDTDRLLHTFRLNAGLPTAAKPYGGWEAPDVEVRGHSLGHYLTACALMYEATGDERLSARARGVVAALAEVQHALAARGANPGYLSAFPESFFDRVEARTGVWAPYYTLHKILAGLLDVYEATSDPTALELARDMARWVGARAARLDDARWQAMLETEFGGMQDALTELFSITRDPEHLRLARLFDHRAVFDPLARFEDRLDGLHANTQIPKAIGAALDCALTGEARYCAVARGFWEAVALHRSYVTGGHSEDEHFSPVRALSRHLAESTSETCNTYNMLKLTRRLFLLDGAPSVLEFYERGLFNHILASQANEPGRMTYFLPLTPGAFRTYSDPEQSFWCCVGTGMENPARFGEAIYAREGDALEVNLLIASTVAWPEKGLVLTQKTRFPDEPATRLALRLSKPARFAIRLRHPAWARSLELSVNGRRTAARSGPGSFEELSREWKDGDTVEALLPMGLSFQTFADDPSRGAFLYGPIVLAADLGGGGLDDARRYGVQAPEDWRTGAPVVPMLVAPGPTAALSRVKPTGESLSFRTVGLGRPSDLELRPFFRLVDHRYAVYLDLLDEAALRARQARADREAAEERAVAARTIDSVVAGDAAQEAAHALEQKGSDSGWYTGRRYRGARWGDEFSYRLALPASGPAVIRALYWGGESRRYRFEVTVEGLPIASQQLFDDRPGEVFPVEYHVPEELSRGRTQLRVGFRPLAGSASGAVFEVRMLRPRG
ncbi:MAG TPA: beta-L-arabinofuranosidase domain-containing protein [Vicinamibacteria bacterium]|nr:beta-L-arabinofuranosidase domain-containing protein [Vicinamibacteria bacterium]